MGWHLFFQKITENSNFSRNVNFPLKNICHAINQLCYKYLITINITSTPTPPEPPMVSNVEGDLIVAIFSGTTPEISKTANQQFLLDLHLNLDKRL